MTSLHSPDFWKSLNLKPGDKLEIEFDSRFYSSPQHQTVEWKDFREYNDYDSPMSFLLVTNQKGAEDSIEITGVRKIISINNTPYKMKRTRRVQSEPERTSASSGKRNGRTAAPVEFEIEEREGRFYCPCPDNKGYSDRSHAIYYHRQHLRGN